MFNQQKFFTVRERDAHVNTAAQAMSGLEQPNECSRLKHVRPFSIIPRLRRQGLLTGSARKPDAATQLFSVTPFANLRCFSMCASPTARSHLPIVRVRVLAFSSVQLALLRSTDRQRKSFEKERYEKKKS